MRTVRAALFFGLFGANVVGGFAFVGCGEGTDATTSGGLGAGAGGTGGAGGRTNDGGSEMAPPDPCEPTMGVTECPNPALRFADVQPIFNRRCVVCHHGMDSMSSWPLTMYRHIKDWEGDVRLHLQGCSMPPPDAGFTTTKEEQLAILTWIRCGGLE